MTSKTDGVDTYTYSWSEDNQLVGVELNSSPVVSYEYDSGSRMLQRIEGSTSTNYHWDGWDLVREEKDDGVDVEITNYLVPQGEVLAFQRDGDWFYLHGDGLSSTQLVTDENGAQVGRAVYGAWGETLSFNESVPGSLDVRFVGGLGVRNDAATGLIYMRHRWYDSELGRFISRDPIGHSGNINLYIYAENNSVRFIDPDGLNPLQASTIDSLSPHGMLRGTLVFPCAIWAMNVVVNRRDSATKKISDRRAICGRGNPDRVEHCMASCLMVRCSGNATDTVAIGIAWEIINPPFEKGDATADIAGALYAKNPAYDSLSCESLCESRLDEYFHV